MTNKGFKLMAIDTLNISEIRKRIDSQLGKCELAIPSLNTDVIESVLDNEQFDNYLQDQIYRWVINAYLVNAKLQEYIDKDQFEAYIQQATTEQGREQLAASILLSAVPLASSLTPMQYMSVDAEENKKPFMSIVAH
jgi:hypothetical protein